jgi:Holliday junction resolvase RusA-like endonuclease
MILKFECFDKTKIEKWNDAFVVIYSMHRNNTMHQRRIRMSVERFKCEKRKMIKEEEIEIYCEE